jgi:proline dehydrogenase
MLIFNNTKIAFSTKTDNELRKAYWLFKTIENPIIVNIGSKLLNLAIFIGFPIKWIIKPTVFQHFCGGETINDSDRTIENLGKSNIGTILDYSVEGNHSESDYEKATDELLSVIEKSSVNKNIPFVVFKVTGIARFTLLERINNDIQLTDEEIDEYERVVFRVDKICNAAYSIDIPVFIDAEETWIQNAIDNISMKMIRKYNLNKALVYNTLQMYRHDRLLYLEEIIGDARRNSYKIGLKLVRGAYMEKERERALINGYQSPIQINKEATDMDFDKAITLCINNADLVSICVGSHNERSNAQFAELIDKKGFLRNDKRFYFAQLLGMSDHISYNLASEGFNVAKYVPYGPVNSVMPYLMRRALENTSVAGQTGRELSLIKTELKRRKDVKI